MANEKRLIDAETVIRKIRQANCPNCDNFNAILCRSCWVDDVIALLDDYPKVDAVEVVHGRWEDEYGGKYANPRYRCSVCKEKANYRPAQDELLSWRNVQVLTPYCPYCMTKLDGGNEDG